MTKTPDGRRPGSPTDPPDPATSEADKLKTIVVDSLAASGEEVKRAVIRKRVEAETDRRADAVAKALDEIGRLEADMKKIKPKNFYAADDLSTPVRSEYTDDQKGELEKLRQKRDKFAGAVAACLDPARSNPEPLDNLLKA